MATPKPGATYRLTGDTIGNAPNAIQSGAVCTVREVVKADVAGAHDDTEDAVVLETDVPALGVTADGDPEVVTFSRAFSVGLSSFDEQFTKES